MSISLVSAANFDNIKKVINIEKGNSFNLNEKVIPYNNLWEKYRPIEIKNFFGLGETLFQGAITEHTETCGENCHSNIQIYLANDGSLIDDVKFLTLQNEKWYDEEIESYKFYIKTGEEEKEVNNYENICTPTGKVNITGDEEQICGNKLTGTHIEKTPVWEEYKLGEEIKAGTYEIKLVGEKKSSSTIDWQIQTNGIWTTDWATWGVESRYEWYVVNDDDYAVVSSTQWQGETFTIGNTGANESFTVTKIALKMFTSGTPGIVTISIKAVNSTGQPTGPDLANGTTDGDTLTADSAGEWRNVTMNTTYELQNTTGKYAVIVRTAASSINLRMNTGDGAYTGGNAVYTTNSGGGWTEYPVHDCMFEIYGSKNTIILNSPADNYITNLNLVNFNCSATSGTLTNISLWHNGTGTWHLNQTNIVSGSTNSTNFTASFSDGSSFLWTCEACDSSGACRFASENRTITIDTSLSLINIIHPLVTEDIGYYNVSQNLSWIIIDTNFDSAWYNYNGTNISLNGAINSTTFQLDGNDRNLTFWANDTAGNVNTTIRNWDYKVFVLNETYTATTISGIINKFLLELRTNGTQVTIGYLNYNNTNILGSISSSGNYYNLTRNQIATGVSTSTNVPFFWNVTMGDGYNFNISSKNQTINPIVINETCGTGMYEIYNLTIQNEITKLKLNGATNVTSIKVDLYLYTSDRATLVSNFYHEYNLTNPIGICIDNNLSNNEQYSLDLQIQYSAKDYSSEFYNIERFVFNSSTLYNNITLYDLDTTNTQKFKLIARDTSYLPIDGALIRVERKYIENGTFYITEIPKTDAKGITSASLQLNDVIYNFYIYQEGVLISSFTNVLAICQTPLISECIIDFNAFNTGISADFTEGEDFDFTIDYNDTSKIITSQFEIPSGEPSTVYLEVIREDALGTAVCSDTLTSASGTLSCIVPSSFGNSTVMAKLYKDNIEQGKGSIKTDQNPSDIFGVILVMMSVLVMMTLIGIGISDSPVISGVFMFVGLILLFSMNLVKNTGFYGATATILFFAIAMILVIIKAARRS